MAVLKMQRINICALKKNRKVILERLQSLGAMEIHIEWEEDSQIKKMDTSGSKDVFEKHSQQAERALEILQKYAPEKKSMLMGLAGKPLIEKASYEQVIACRDQYLSTVKKIINLDKEILEVKARIMKLESRMEELTPWLSLDIPMSFPGTKKTALLLGTIPGTIDTDEVYEMLIRENPEVKGCEVKIISRGRDYTYLAVVCMKAEGKMVEEALRSGGFARPSHLIREKPVDRKELLMQEIHEGQGRIQEIEEQISKMEDSREQIRLLADYFRIRADKYQILGLLPQTENTFMISGYVPAKEAQHLAEELREHFEAMVEVEELEEEEEPPVLLENNRFSKSAEGVLAAFGLPAKGEMDPTSVMSFFYIFLFGLMLSDAAYGLIVMLVCGILLLKFPRMGKNMKKSMELFFWCGVSTLFWGVLFGGYFGDVIDVIGKTFLGIQLPEGQSILPALWFVPLDDPMKMLVYSMLFGLIHLFFGLALKGYVCLKDKKYMDFFCDVVLWFFLVAGLLIMLLPTELFASITQMHIALPPVISFAGKLFAAAGALGILLMSGRTAKNFGLRIALGAYDLYNITGWLSDVLSYSRLLALGLATGVIASVVNQMGAMAGSGILGVLLFIVVFVIGHTFNIGINLLGAYVHTCRLQYVEFFGKFYEGGGREFNPFHENTKYVDVKEEKYL